MGSTESTGRDSRSRRLTLQTFGARAQFGRNVGRERAEAGLAAAVARERSAGRPKKGTLKQPELLVQL